MKTSTAVSFINNFIALVWLTNGLLCKVLNLVPRHQKIVERVLNTEYAGSITILIGFAEVAMGAWILLGFWSRLNTILQITLIAIMNILEFVLAPDILLWGKANAIFAFLFISLIYYKEFHLYKDKKNKVSSLLKDHPFAVEAFFRRSIVLTFALPKEQLNGLIPECLELDVFDKKWAFIAIAMVQTESLRPKGFPKFLGNHFYLIGYRAFVKFKNKSGKNLRGLYILGSETDKKKMKFFGNIFTHYNYTDTDISQTCTGELIEISSKKSGFKIEIENNNTDNVPLPEGSPFNDWKEARRFAGPLPFTFTYTPGRKKVLIVEGVRENWKPRPVRVIDYQIPFLDNRKLNHINLASAFIIENIPYYWKKGKTELWRKEEDSKVS